jgi:hypothetical protein
LKKPLALPYLHKAKEGKYKFEKQNKTKRGTKEKKRKSNKTKKMTRINKEVHLRNNVTKRSVDE